MLNIGLALAGETSSPATLTTGRIASLTLAVTEMMSLADAVHRG